MGRSRASAKKAGTLFESQCAQYFTETLGRKVIRAPKTGAKDKGDLYGLMFHDDEVVVECKSPGRDVSWSLSGWWNETIKEMDNAGTHIGILAVKRMSKPTNKAFCILDEERWDHFNAGIHTPVEHKSLANSELGKLVDEHTVISSPRRGKDGKWIVTDLETIMSIFAERTKHITVNITPEDLTKLIETGELIIRSTDGQSIQLLHDR